MFRCIYDATVYLFLNRNSFFFSVFVLGFLFFVSVYKLSSILDLLFFIYYLLCSFYFFNFFFSGFVF